MPEQFIAAAMESAEEYIYRLQEDAERYRWLRQQQAIGCWPQVVDGLNRLAGDALDVAVDSAMSAERQSPAAVTAILRLN
jgi:hypothetical protein